MRTRISCVAAALVCLTGPAAGQTLTEDEALARLSTESPRVRAIRASVDVARVDVLTAGRWPNPRVTFNREAVAGVTENMFLVTQPLPITGRRGLEIGAASALVSASERRADDEVRRARAGVRSAYADLVSAQVRETELARLRERLQELSDVLARREAAGEAAGYDRLRADREAMDIDADWAIARADRARAQANLAAFFVAPGDVSRIAAVVPDAQRKPELPGVDSLVTHALAVLGEPDALQKEIESAEMADRAAQRRMVPEPEIVAGTKSSTLAGGDLGGVFSLHFTVPLFDHARPEQSLAQAHRGQATARADAFQVSLRAQVASLRAIVMERREAADRYRMSAAASAGQLERIAQVSYDAGEGGILELLDAYRSGGAVRTRQAVLDTAVRQSEIELELVSGWEIR
jgi:outer membrane protein, heavy metal efflux system